MRFALAAVIAALSFAAAHPHALPGMPNIIGSPELNARIRARAAEIVAYTSGDSAAPAISPLERRDDRCGASNGGKSCPAGQCCSSGGWCGTGKDYCAAPDCQIDYSGACDGNQKPTGVDTTNVARTKPGPVPYGGEGFYGCTKPGTIALTYDDGPYLYTGELLDMLASYDAKATFFITGNNIGKGQINKNADWSSLIRRMDAEGHQIASHTWSHQNLDQITSAQRKQQMIYNEIAIQDIVGYFPTYMRPPYSACVSAACKADMNDLGYHISYFDLDTDDYNNLTPAGMEVSKSIFDDALAGKNPATAKFHAIAHDIHALTVRTLTAYMLQEIDRLGYKAVTVGECMSDPKANWYRSSGGSTPTGTTTSNPTSTTSTSTPTNTGTLQVSKDGKCGNGFTCKGSEFGDCCSKNGWCGSTTDYCDAGCQSAFGTCNGVTNPTTTTTSKASTCTTVRTTTSTTPQPTTGATVSKDGKCGNGFTCKGSEFGDCCSQHGWCGSTAAYCAAGCQSAFGTCN